MAGSGRCKCLVEIHTCRNRLNGRWKWTESEIDGLRRTFAEFDFLLLVQLLPLPLFLPNRLSAPAINSSGSMRARSRISAPGLSIGGPPVLAGAVAGHHQMRVAAALPVQQQVNLAALDRRDNLHQHCPKETLAQLRQRALMTPDPLQVLAHLSKQHRRRSRYQ